MDAAELILTENFDRPVQPSVSVSPDGRNAMTILKEQAETETTFGGGYVSAISGLGEEKKGGANRHWFFYVNGALASRGALQYVLEESWNLWWDFHAWDGQRFVSAVIGAWPEPFLSGSEGKKAPVAIWTADDFRSEANAIRDRLIAAGVSKVQVKMLASTSAVSFEREVPILLGTWQNLMQNGQFSDWIRHGERMGLFLKSDDGQTLSLLDWKGTKKKSLKPAAAIVAMKPVFGTALPIWVITGTDLLSVRAASDLIVRQPEKLKGFAGLMLVEGERLHVPAFE